MSRFVFKPGHRMTEETIRAGLTTLYGKPIQVSENGNDGRWKNKDREIKVVSFESGPYDIYDPFVGRIYVRVFSSGRTVVHCDASDSRARSLLTAWRTGK
jgi:hypothetical protein